MEECDNCETPRPRLITVDDGTGRRRVCGVCVIAVIAVAERRAIRENRASVVVLLDEAAQEAAAALVPVAL